MADFLESNLFRPTAPREPFFKKPRRKKIKVDEDTDAFDQEPPKDSRPFAAIGVASLAASQILDTHATKQKKVMVTNGLVRIPGPPVTPTRRRRNIPTNASQSGPSPSTKETRSPQRVALGRSRSFRAKKGHDYENVSLRRNSIVGLQVLKILAEREASTSGEGEVSSVCQVLEQFNKMNLVQDKTKQTVSEENKRKVEASKTNQDNTVSQTKSAPAKDKNSDKDHELAQTSESSGEKPVTAEGLPQKTEDACKKCANNKTSPDTTQNGGEDSDLQPCKKHRKDKRKKLLRLLRLLLGLSWKRKPRKEDKQFLITEEVTQEEDSSRGTVLKKPKLSKKVSFRTKHCIDDQAAGSRGEPAFLVSKKRRPRKKTMRRASRRMKKSLGRGCRYIGHGLANMTSMIPEASYVGPITPYRDFDDDYITGDYI
ncbi:uncharacterized protein LOC119583682 [Penaeus monodon]|uniref:uncharacterized protein LOC119583682 n=1 Tax=Penaeus monodon TaxID=6687 RepID=UPI0018A73B52|nr:uncharacterized protein LOC119583682 [Penaeus monodon]XP_037788222.1 uncharacterized protein LOC119583682 [Penaeus monodon]XP_037788223.1 uncharacterized protein LOC119583682 [Penaeus monodon]XP_037788224.1 uncharacterized protein LOC119583682 [Penaeus monodon]XP_037788226.1 uncharacterized protein LOC119583682 [Penaeus monodon]XP_037788227.1 uncharacterized protein LOC119583682 [Penaeus monodon]XP_037788228.1 uncharacterized protein LOC119583682 [Penaeus monodon]XP_037788229.1 uncharacte